MIHKILSVGEEALSHVGIFLATFLISVGACTPKQVSCGGSNAEVSRSSGSDSPSSEAP